MKDTAANRLIIFVKAPRLGTVKTRLAAEIGAPAALDAYQRLVATVLESLKDFPGIQLSFTPDDSAAGIAPWLRDGGRSIQNSMSLGSTPYSCCSTPRDHSAAVC
ncbi:MAG: hypothetical protein HC814_05040 [Rhodobacteraceae bacterium]|nr:hypothetical protein [Paracoccaceae bacterium]